jgi:SAM-dependent methyltransferase
VTNPSGRGDLPGDGSVGDWTSYFEEDPISSWILRAEAVDYVQRLEAALPLDGRARVLDFGCGAGLVADMLAPKVGELFLWDAATSMKRRAREQTADRANVRFLDLSFPHPSRVRFDLILVNSVVQYMAADELSSWLMRWGEMLAPGGRLVLSDLIPPTAQSLLELAALAGFCARRGLLLRVLWAAPRELMRYAKVRGAHPLYRTTPDEFRDSARAAGWAVEFLRKNLTYRRQRFAVLLTQPARRDLR